MASNSPLDKYKYYWNILSGHRSGSSSQNLVSGHCMVSHVVEEVVLLNPHPTASWYAVSKSTAVRRTSVHIGQGSTSPLSRPPTRRTFAHIIGQVSPRSQCDGRMPSDTWPSTDETDAPSPSTATSTAAGQSRRIPNMSLLPLQDLSALRVSSKNYLRVQLESTMVENKKIDIFWIFDPL